MALIKCPECNKEISDKAKQCPHCGYPVREMINIINSNPIIDVTNNNEYEDKLAINDTSNQSSDIKANKRPFIKKVVFILLGFVVCYAIYNNVQNAEKHTLPISSDQQNTQDSGEEIDNVGSANNADSPSTMPTVFKPKMYAPNSSSYRLYYVKYVKGDDPSDVLSGSFELSEDKEKYVFDGSISSAYDLDDGKLFRLEDGKMYLVYEGMFLGGQFYGEGKSYYVKEGDPIEYIGRLSGNKWNDDRAYTFYENGGLKAVSGYKDDKKDGYAALYYESGKIKYVGYFTNDLANGDGAMLNDDYSNSMAGYAQFKNGELHGFGLMYNDYGEVAEMGMYYEGEYTGPPTEAEILKIEGSLDKLIDVMDGIQESLYKDLPNLKYYDY